MTSHRQSCGWVNQGDQVEHFDEGLRCQDVHSGLRNVDPHSSLLAPLVETRIVGMAATIAGLIRGRDVVTDAQSLMTVAAEQLDVDSLVFDKVVGVLEEAEFVEGVQRHGTRIVGFTETVPYYDGLYETLGEIWRSRQPTDVEQQLLVVVDGLSVAPVPLESLEDRYGLDRADLPGIVDVGRQTGLIQTLRTIDGDLAYSPFFGFENPELFGELAETHGSERLILEFEQMRNRQGLPINPEQFPLLTDAVARGLIMAPAVTLPNGTEQPFAALPYVPDHRLLVARKPVLDKALAVLACLRCGESFGQHNSLPSAALVSVIDKLLDPNRGMLAPHEGHERQYALMVRAGIIRFGPDPMPGGRWVTPVFIDTEDNREALQVARDLIVHGEPVTTRVDDATARKVLTSGEKYTTPIQTMHRTRTQANVDPTTFRAIFDAAMERNG